VKHLPDFSFLNGQLRAMLELFRTRTFEIDGNDFLNPAGMRRHDSDPVRDKHCFAYIVRDEYARGADLAQDLRDINLKLFQC
jgi:hypothetical protein